MADDKKSFVDKVKSNRHQVDNSASTFAGKFASKRGDGELKKNMMKARSGEEENTESKIADLKKKCELSTEKSKGSAAERLRRSRLDCLFLVKGLDETNGKHAWHYVLVDRERKTAFLEAAKKGPVDVSKYGTVHCSGWGKEPPQDVVDKVKEEFGG